MTNAVGASGAINGMKRCRGKYLSLFPCGRKGKVLKIQDLGEGFLGCEAPQKLFPMFRLEKDFKKTHN